MTQEQQSLEEMAEAAALKAWPSGHDYPEREAYQAGYLAALTQRQPDRRSEAVEAVRLYRAIPVKNDPERHAVFDVVMGDAIAICPDQIAAEKVASALASSQSIGVGEPVVWSWELNVHERIEKRLTYFKPEGGGILNLTPLYALAKGSEK